MRIQVTKMMRILADPDPDPDPQQCMEDLENNALSSLLFTEPTGGVSATPPPPTPPYTYFLSNSVTRRQCIVLQVPL
jgi:hypothetical protein